MGSKDKKCAHPSCNCKAAADSDYCSPYCKAAKGTMEISCNCGHAGCAIGEGVPERMTGRPG